MADPRRTAALVPVTVLLGAALTLLGALPRWLGQRYGTDGSGSLSRNGFQAAPALLPLALVALAALGAGYAARGVLRRAVGAVTMLIGVGVAIAALSAGFAPAAYLTSDAGLPAPKDLMGPVTRSLWGPVVSAAGGVVLLAGGLLVLAGIGARTLGVRYDRNPAAGPAQPVTVARSSRSPAAAANDADEVAALWRSLDAGLDPTALDPGSAHAPTSPRGAALPDQGSAEI